MTTTINADTVTGGAIITGDASGELGLQTAGTTRMTFSGATINIPTAAARITGDFSNATQASRVMFQTSTTNGNTTVSAIPNGTGSATAFGLFTSSSVGSAALILRGGADTSDARIIAGTDSTGVTSYPMTFYTGGSERVRIDTSGNVGIGAATNASQGRLQVLNTSITGGAPSTSGTTDANQLTAFTMGATQLRFGVYLSGAAWIQHGASSTYAVNYDLVLQPNGGNVGIGTSSPGTKLDAYNSGTASTSVRVRNDSSSVYLDANNGYTYLNTFSNHPMLFGTNNTERMRIDSSGTLSVLTPSSGYTIDIRGRSSDGVGVMRFVNYAYTAELARVQTDGASALIFATSSSATERMRIDASGNVQIGTTTAGQKLTVNGGYASNGPPTTPTVDTSLNFVTYTNGATVDFSSFSGVIIVNDLSTGNVSMYLVGGAGIVNLGSSTGVASGTITYVAGINGYRWTNTAGVSRIVAFATIRTRAAA